MKISLISLCVFIGAVALCSVAASEPPRQVSYQGLLTDDSGEQIRWQVISSGGDNDGTSANYGLSGTIGQTASGVGTSSNYELNHGFWQNFGNSVCGDADGSEAVDIDDVVYLIAYIFSGGPEPVPYESADADCSGGVDIDDVVYLIAYIFSGGNSPCDTDGDEVPNC